VCDGSGIDPHPGYAYRFSEPVSVGDIVLTPANWQFRQPQEATVVRIGTTYEGALTPIRRVLRHVGEPAAERGGEAAS